MHFRQLLSLRSTNADDEVLQALADYNRALRRLVRGAMPL